MRSDRLSHITDPCQLGTWHLGLATPPTPGLISYLTSLQGTQVGRQVAGRLAGWKAKRSCMVVRQGRTQESGEQCEGGQKERHVSLAMSARLTNGLAG